MLALSSIGADLSTCRLYRPPDLVFNLLSFTRGLADGAVSGLVAVGPARLVGCPSVAVRSDVVHEAPEVTAAAPGHAAVCAL